MKKLGFGMMRLPVISGPTDFNFEELNKMVDAFLDAGYTYFDTSFVYHDGKSEEATRKAISGEAISGRSHQKSYHRSASSQDPGLFESTPAFGKTLGMQ